MPFHSRFRHIHLLVMLLNGFIHVLISIPGIFDFDFLFFIFFKLDVCVTICALSARSQEYYSKILQ
jgi:hypothetical protein